MPDERPESCNDINTVLLSAEMDIIDDYEFPGKT